MNKTLRRKNKQPELLKWFTFSLLMLTLFLLGLQNSFLFLGLGEAWQGLASALGLPERLRESTTHSYPYRLICVLLCISLVHVYFRDWRKTSIVVAIYGIAFLISVLLVWVSRGPGQDESIAYEMAKSLIGGMVSPFLAVMFIPTLHLLKQGSNESNNY